MSILQALLALILLQRAGELVLAAVNTRRLRALGAFEVDRAGYPLFVALHAGWLFSLAVLVPAKTAPSWPLLGFYGVLQFGRIWAIATLGSRWTTRLMVLPDAPLMRAGPYRFCRHPNYLVVAGEIAVLPLAFGAIGIAIVFSIANAALLARRIRLEDRALARTAEVAAQPSQSRGSATMASHLHEMISSPYDQPGD